MDLAFRPPVLLPIVLVVVVTFGVAAALLKKWQPVRKIAAILIDAGTTRYLFGLNDMDALLRETARHVAVRKLEGGTP